jgi:hypothetical protein
MRSAADHTARSPRLHVAMPAYGGAARASRMRNEDRLHQSRSEPGDFVGTRSLGEAAPEPWDPREDLRARARARTARHERASHRIDGALHSRDGSSVESKRIGPSNPQDRGGTSSCSRQELFFYSLRLGTFGSGGPIDFAGHMQADLVEHRRCVSKEDYVEGVAFAPLASGPLAAQLAFATTSLALLVLYGFLFGTGSPRR